MKLFVSGESSYEGGVYINNLPVCDDIWNEKHAKVVCRSLRFSPNTIAKAYLSSKFGDAPNDNFIMDNVKCYGDEEYLGQCDYETDENCDKGEVAGVLCIDPKSLEIRG